MTIVKLRSGESGDDLLKRFNAGVQKSGILRQLREKRYHTPKGELRRRKKAKALRRIRKKAVRTNYRMR